MRLPIGFDLPSLEVFVLTAELGGMTASARRLGMTQSAVSQVILKLETALDVRLFDRATRPLSLTPGGKLLFADGQRLIAGARGLMRELREGSARPISAVTIAMAESIANHLTAPLLGAFSERVERWRIHSGISMLQHHDFAARKLDMLITGSSQLEDVEEIEHHAIMDEGFILIAPPGWIGAGDPMVALAERRFVRYSLASAMGQRIERQASRLKLKLPNRMEVDSTMQQMTAVAEGIGWSITTPLCVASHPDLWDAVDIRPLPRGQFRRRIQVVARGGEFGDLPRQIALHARAVLRGGRISDLCGRYPWIADTLGWLP